jgi:cytochrome c-type protein NapB
MKSRLLTILPAVLLAGLALFPYVSFGTDDGGLVTLRGAPIPESVTDSENALKKPIESLPMERDFTQQPPLVSHAVDNYPVTKNFNKCMDCHSWERYREAKATKVSQTHFKTSEGQDLANISPRRYFCLQCHVPQVDAKPLVANDYERAKISR